MSVRARRIRQCDSPMRGAGHWFCFASTQIGSPRPLKSGSDEDIEQFSNTMPGRKAKVCVGLASPWMT